MNLVIDIGNTKVKLAIFEGSELVLNSVVRHEEMMDHIKRLKGEFKELNKAILSSVVRLEQANVDLISENLNLLVLDDSINIPFNNTYATPETLGVDRIALVSASVQQYQNQNVLIIDAGTCITYDFINMKNDYMGGSISPGMRLRYESMNNLTAKLPLLKAKMPDHLIGNSTAESMHSGVIHGITHEIDGIITEYENKFKDLTVILTGGDADFLAKRLKSSIFAHSNFLLEGLNFILEYNSNE
jgi:type III pantothenate kinase